MTSMSKDDILNLSVDGADTIRDYLYDLLTTMIRDGEGFNSKRPFGNSGWEFDLYVPLINEGLVEGEIGEYVVIQAADELLQELVKYAFYGE